MLTVVGSTVIGMILVFWLNIILLRRKLPKWRSYFIPGFVVTIGDGRVNSGKIALWTSMDFSEADARTIARHQMMCMLEMPIGFFVGIALNIVENHYLS